MTDPKSRGVEPKPVQSESDNENEYESADDPHKGRHEGDGYYDDDGQWHDNPDETTPALPDVPTPRASMPTPPLPDSEPDSPGKPGFFEDLVMQALTFAREELENCLQERQRVKNEDFNSRFGTGIGTGDRPGSGFDRNSPAPALPDCSVIERNITTLEELLARLRRGGDEQGPRVESEEDNHDEPPITESSTGRDHPQPDWEDLVRRIQARDENLRRLIRELPPPPVLPPRSFAGLPKYAHDLYRFLKPFVEAVNRAEEYNPALRPAPEKSASDDQT
jgi:hypothetical protein